MNTRTRIILGGASTAALVASIALFAWVALSAAQDGSEGPPPGAAGGARPESPTATLQAIPDSTREQALARLDAEGVGGVVDDALAGNVDALLDHVAFIQHACDDPKALGEYDGAPSADVCGHHGVARGARLPLFYLPGAELWVDRETLGLMMSRVLGAPDVEFVFSASLAHGAIGVSFAATPRPNPGGAEVAGTWLTVQPGQDTLITEVYFHGKFSGPKQLFQATFQPAGGRPWYYDEANSPGSAPPKTPDAPPTR